jgi:hypothetical protein
MKSIWIANSLTAIIAYRVFASRSRNMLSDMATLALCGQRASTGLLAVRQGDRSRGLGRRVIHAAFDTAQGGRVGAVGNHLGQHHRRLLCL